MGMTSIEIKVPEKARQYVLNNTTEKMRNALLLYHSIATVSYTHLRAHETF